MQHSFYIICKMENQSQAHFSNGKPILLLFPALLHSNAASWVLWGGGFCLMASHRKRTCDPICYVLYDHASTYLCSFIHPAIKDKVIDGICPVSTFFCSYGPYFLPDPPAKFSPSYKASLQAHSIRLHIFLQSLPLLVLKPYMVLLNKWINKWNT